MAHPYETPDVEIVRDLIKPGRDPRHAPARLAEYLLTDSLQAKVGLTSCPTNRARKYKGEFEKMVLLKRFRALWPAQHCERQIIERVPNELLLNKSPGGNGRWPKRIRGTHFVYVVLRNGRRTTHNHLGVCGLPSMIELTAFIAEAMLNRRHKPVHFSRRSARTARGKVLKGVQPELFGPEDGKSRRAAVIGVLTPPSDYAEGLHDLTPRDGNLTFRARCFGPDELPLRF